MSRNTMARTGTSVTTGASAADGTAERRRPPVAGAHLSLSAAVWFATMAATVPLMSVISPGGWVAGVLFVAAAIVAVGFVARRHGRSAMTVLLWQVAVWAVLVAVIFLRVTPDPVAGLARERAATPFRLVAEAIDEIIHGAAPLAPALALSFVVVTATGLVAIFVDQAAGAARTPLAGVVVLIMVSIIPSVAVPGAFDVVGFVVLAAAILFLLRTETRTRYLPPHAVPSAPGTTSAIAISIGVVTVLVAVAATPLLPEPPARAIGGVGGTSINASLNLGSDLRRPDPVTALTLTTSDPSAPYLRVATLSDFDNRTWNPDKTTKSPLATDNPFGALVTAPDIDVREVTTTIHIDQLNAQYLPVPFAATAVDGASYPWQALPASRTVEATAARTSPGTEYRVTSQEAEPTLEQIRAASARESTPETADAMAVPMQLPEVITRDALTVTAGTTTDYDALIALQDWLRGPEFTYSLTAPRQDRYDSSGVAGVAAFLRQKSGYCIHFASAFAIMARVLGMNSRIVVGYLPGTPSDEPSGDTVVYSVSSAQLHAWPEVYFTGIGWVGFDPTKSLGVPTSFLPASIGAGSGTTETDIPSTAPTAAPSNTPRADPEGLRSADTATGRTEAASANLLPWGLALGGLIVVLFAPAGVGFGRRRRRDAAARAGDPFAAWTSVCEVAIDLGIPLPDSQSPRALGARLQEIHGAPAREMATLVDAVEYAAYAPPQLITGQQGRQVADAAAAVRTGLYLAVPSARRLRALLAPRSLLVRPGSTYAREGDDAARARERTAAHRTR